MPLRRRSRCLLGLTHVADTGLLLSSTDQLQFGDSGTYIHQSADGVLDLVSDTEIEINATTIDMNGALDVSGVVTAAGFTIGSAVIFIGGAYFLIQAMGGANGIWVAVLVGAIGGIVVGLVTEYYTGGAPVRKIAKDGETGPATVMISGLATGMQSVAIPALTIAAIIYCANAAAGLYGVGLAAVGMLSTVGITMAIDAYGPVADNAGGIAEMANMGKETREINGRMYVLEESLTADYALVKAWKGDKYGNLIYKGTARNFNPMMAMAGKITIAEVEELVEPGELDPNQVHTPGIFVQRIFQGKNYEKRIEQRTVSQ